MAAGHRGTAAAAPVKTDFPSRHNPAFQTRLYSAPVIEPSRIFPRRTLREESRRCGARGDAEPPARPFPHTQPTQDGLPAGGRTPPPGRSRGGSPRRPPSFAAVENRYLPQEFRGKTEGKKPKRRCLRSGPGRSGGAPGVVRRRTIPGPAAPPVGGGRGAAPVKRGGGGRDGGGGCRRGGSGAGAVPSGGSAPSGSPVPRGQSPGPRSGRGAAGAAPTPAVGSPEPAAARAGPSSPRPGFPARAGAADPAPATAPGLHPRLAPSPLPEGRGGGSGATHQRRSPSPTRTGARSPVSPRRPPARRGPRRPPAAVRRGGRRTGGGGGSAAGPLSEAGAGLGRGPLARREGRRRPQPLFPRGGGVGCARPGQARGWNGLREENQPFP